MAKKTLDITNFIGGINRFKSHRDLADNEFLELINLSPENLTYLRTFNLSFKPLVNFSDIIDYNALSNGEFTYGVAMNYNGYNIFIFTHDYSFINELNEEEPQLEVFDWGPETGYVNSYNTKIIDLTNQSLEDIPEESITSDNRDFICIAERGKVHIYDLNSSIFYKNAVSLDSLKEQFNEDEEGTLDDRVSKYTSQVVYDYIDGALRFCESNFNRNTPEIDENNEFIVSHTGKLNHIKKTYFRWISNEALIPDEEIINENGEIIDEIGDNQEELDDDISEDTDTFIGELLPNGAFDYGWSYTWDRENTEASFPRPWSMWSDIGTGSEEERKMYIDFKWEHLCVNFDQLASSGEFVDPETGQELNVDGSFFNNFIFSEWGWNIARWGGWSYIGGEISYNEMRDNSYHCAFRSLDLNNNNDASFHDINSAEFYKIEIDAHWVCNDDVNFQTSAIDIEFEICGVFRTCTIFKNFSNTYSIYVSGTDLISGLNSGDSFIKVRISPLQYRQPFTQFFDNEWTVDNEHITTYQCRAIFDNIFITEASEGVNSNALASGLVSIAPVQGLYSYTAGINGISAWSLRESGEGGIIDPWSLTLADLGNTDLNLPIAGRKIFALEDGNNNSNNRFLFLTDTEATASNGFPEDYITFDQISGNQASPNVYVDTNTDDDWDTNEANMNNWCFGVDATDSNNEIRLGMVDRSWDYDVGSQPGNGGFSWLQNQATTMASNFLQNNFQNARFNAHYQMYRATDPKCSFYTAPGYGENFNVIEANTGYIDDQFATDLMPDPSLDKNQLPNKVPGMPVMQKISSTAADNYILSLKWQNNSGWRGYFDADMLGSWKRNGSHLGNLVLKLVPDNTSHEKGLKWLVEGEGFSNQTQIQYNDDEYEQYFDKQALVDCDRDEFYAPIGLPIVRLWKRYYNEELGAWKWRFDVIPFQIDRNNLASKISASGIATPFDPDFANTWQYESENLSSEWPSMENVKDYFDNELYFFDNNPPFVDTNFSESSFMTLVCNVGSRSRPCNIAWYNAAFSPGQHGWNTGGNTSNDAEWGLNCLDGDRNLLLSGLKFKDYDYIQIVDPQYPHLDGAIDLANPHMTGGDSPVPRFSRIKDISFTPGEYPDPTGGLHNVWSDSPLSSLDENDELIPGENEDVDDLGFVTFPIKYNKWKVSNSFLPSIPNNRKPYGGWWIRSSPIPADLGASWLEGNEDGGGSYPEQLKQGGVGILFYNQNDVAFENTGSWEGGTYILGFSYVDIDGNESKLAFDSSKEITIYGNRPIKFNFFFRTPTPDATAAGWDERIVKIRTYVKKVTNDKWGSLLCEIDFEKGFKYKFPHGSLTKLIPLAGTAKGTLCLTGTLTKETSIKAKNIFGYEELNDWNGTDNISVRYKARTFINRRAYIGNIAELIEASPDAADTDELLQDAIKKPGEIANIYPDRMLKSPVNQFDIFPHSNFIDVRIDDGDEIIALESYAGRILQFRKTNLYIINCLKELEFLESEMAGKGISHKANVTMTPFGIAWINITGVYLFNGKEVVELTRQKLTTEYILNLFFGHNPDNLDSSQGVFILSYNQSLNSLVITNSGSKHELYFNFKTNSWYGGAWNYRFSNTNYGGFNNEISLQSNIAQGGDGNVAVFNSEALLYGGKSFHNDPEDSAEFWYSPLTMGSHGICLTTGEIDFGNPSQDKIIYKLKIKYKHHINANTEERIHVGFKTDMKTYETSLEFNDSDIDNDVTLEEYWRQGNFTKFTTIDGLTQSYLPSSIEDSTDNSESAPIDANNPSDFRIAVVQFSSNINCKSIAIKLWSENDGGGSGSTTDFILDNITIVYREKPVR